MAPKEPLIHSKMFYSRRQVKFDVRLDFVESPLNLNPNLLPMIAVLTANACVV